MKLTIEVTAEYSTAVQWMGKVDRKGNKIMKEGYATCYLKTANGRIIATGSGESKKEALRDAKASI